MKSGYCLRPFGAIMSVSLVLGLSSGPGFGQEPAKVAPQFYKVLQDNAEVRVLEIHLPPGQKSPMHSHPDYVIYNFGPCKVRFTFPDGKTAVLEFKGGETAFRPAETHAVENIGDTEAHVLNIELKQPPKAVAQEEHRSVQPGDIHWTPGPEGLPAGGQMAVLSGDPMRAGLYTVRFKAPAGYKIPAHWHSATEQITVLSGTFYLGMGDMLDESKAQALSQGSFSSMPAGMHHFAWTRDPAVIQITGVGPWDIHYLNRADDPRQHLTPTGRTQ